MRRLRKKSAIRAEVNLTPLIDVMMSLLAIFMITAPLLTSGIPLNLPKGDGKSLDSAEKTLDISIDAKGQTFIGTQKVADGALIEKVTAVVRQNPDIQMIISGDEKTPYGRVIETMAALRVAGFSQVALKTDAKVTTRGKGK